MERPACIAYAASALIHLEFEDTCGREETVAADGPREDGRSAEQGVLQQEGGFRAGFCQRDAQQIAVVAVNCRHMTASPLWVSPSSGAMRWRRKCCGIANWAITLTVENSP